MKELENFSKAAERKKYVAPLLEMFSVESEPMLKRANYWVTTTGGMKDDQENSIAGEGAEWSTIQDAWKIIEGDPDQIDSKSHLWED